MARLGVAASLALLVVAAACWLPSQATGGALDSLVTVPSSSVGLTKKCAGAVGECGVDEDEELGLGGGEALLRRSMAQRQPTNRYISYAALRADQVPCNKRGRSYYTNCASQQQANPYRRGCSAITRCARTTS